MIQATAIWGILDARQRVVAASRSEMEESIQAQAATLAAALETLHADLRFFTHSQPVTEAPQRMAQTDPVSRRWARLELNGVALLFLEGHPALARLYVESADGELLTAVGWRQGSAVILRRDEITAGLPTAELRESVWELRQDRLGTTGRVRAWLDPDRLLARTLPAATGLHLDREPPTPNPAESGSVFSAAVEAPEWEPPLRLWLWRTVESGALIGAMEPIVGGFRRTLILNLIIIAASALLGIAVLRQTRRAATAEAELRHRKELLEMERRVEHSERLATVGRLAAGVAHEINNPLSGVVNYLSLMEKELEEGDAEDSRTLLARVRDGVDRAAEVVHRVLTFAEPGHGEKQRLDLTELALSTFQFVRANPSYRHLEFLYDGSDEPIPVEGDGAALSQLVLNLLLNACDLQADGGSVELRVSLSEERAKIEILDRGPGLSAEAREHLFEPFYSGRGSTGLGLAVCHGIVESHGGSIDARNRPEGGAHFVVQLHEAEDTIPASPPAEHRRETPEVRA